MRYHYYTADTTYSNFSPRLSVKRRLTDKIILKAATGIYHQYLNRIPRAFIADIWTVANRHQKESTSKHYILGYQQEFANNVELELETFYKTYNNIYSFNDAFLASVFTTEFENGIPIYRETTGLFHEGYGKSMGFEVLLKKSLGLVNGWIGYSWLKTEFTFPELNHGNAFAPCHDKTSTLNMVANIKIKPFFHKLTGRSNKRDKNEWLLGFNFVYSSGQPITRPGSGYVINSLPDFLGTRNLFTGDSRNFVLYPGEINKYRLPAYIRLDLSLRYTRQFNGWSMASYLQVFNVGNRKVGAKFTTGSTDRTNHLPSGSTMDGITILWTLPRDYICSRQ